ncbi:RHS repeat-associated core domain-containing protein, partial [Escherichia coli]
GHRLKQAGNTQYDYDAAGRMVSRTRHRDGYRPETERFRWDSRDQLTGYCSAQGEQWEYRHDASGRRTEKRCDRKKIRFTYLWDGDSIAEIREYRDDKLYSVRHLVFNGFELISQQFSRVRQAHPSVAPQWVTRTNHAVSDLTGRPLMLFNSEGKTVWRPGQTSLWGLVLSLPADTGYPDPRGELDAEAAPGLLYAGQWQDAESGLCYNRFRYYEPETGMYLVSDPLGLQGGEQTYRYVPNPCGYVDPLGLAKTSVPVSIVEPKKITGNFKTIREKLRLARNGDVSAQAEIAYAKYMRSLGKDVHFNTPPNRSVSMADFTIDGIQVDTKLLSGIGGNAAKNVNKGVGQVGDNGIVLVIRNSNSKNTLEEFHEFFGNFKPNNSTVRVEVIDQSVLEPFWRF